MKYIEKPPSCQCVQQSLLCFVLRQQPAPPYPGHPSRTECGNCPKSNITTYLISARTVPWPIPQSDDIRGLNYQYNRNLELFSCVIKHIFQARNNGITLLRSIRTSHLRVLSHAKLPDVDKNMWYYMLILLFSQAIRQSSIIYIYEPGHPFDWNIVQYLVPVNIQLPWLVWQCAISDNFEIDELMGMRFCETVSYKIQSCIIRRATVSRGGSHQVTLGGITLSPH